jgi:hypothetical protein
VEAMGLESTNLLTARRFWGIFKLVADLRGSVNLLVGCSFLVPADIPRHPLFLRAARGFRGDRSMTPEQMSSPEGLPNPERR